jgi:hypothetical protein
MASLLINGVGVRWGLPNYTDWSIDSIAPHGVWRGIEQHFSNGWWGPYPPLHLELLAVLYVPYLQYLKMTGGFSGEVTTEALADPLHALGNLILMARIVSVLMGVGVVLIVFLVVRELFDRRAAFFAAAMVALNHVFAYYAHAANVDVAYLFWALLGLYAFVMVLKRGSIADYLLFALFATFAICAKDQAYGLFLLSPLLILWQRHGEHRGVSTMDRRSTGRVQEWRSLLFDRRNLVAAAAACMTFVLVHNLPLNLEGFVAHVRFITGSGSDPFQQFPATLAGRLGLLRHTGWYVAAALTKPLFFVTLAGSVYCLLRAPRRTLPLLLLVTSYYLLFINLVLYVYPRQVLPIAIVLSFFGGKLLADLWQARPWRMVTRPAIAAAFAYATIFPLQLDLLFLEESRHDAERWLEQHVRAGDIIETFAPPWALGAYYPRFPARVRVRAGRLAEGTRWIAIRDEALDPPNAYFGTEPPDYIVLSDWWYLSFEGSAQHPAEARVLEELFDGRLGYTLVANFKKHERVFLLHLPINPRILVFQQAELTAVRRD